MKITALIENQAQEGFACEHGLCIHIDYHGHNYLLDTGASGKFLENADKLGIDLSKVDAAFLSHAHYDHSGGYPEFFAQNQKASVYLQESAKDSHYFKILGPLKKDIGIPGGILETYPERFHFLKGDTQIHEGVHLLAHHTKGLETRGKRAHMYHQTKTGLLVDDFSHEQTLVFRLEKGLVLFNSCSHGGIENIIEEVKTAFPGQPILATFGGFHLMGPTGVGSCNFTKEEVLSLGHTLLKTPDTLYYTCHCTGEPAFAWLSEIMGNRLHSFHSGDVITFADT